MYTDDNLGHLSKEVMINVIKTGMKETRKRLSEYINMVQKGEEIIITRRDKPVAKLVPVEKRD